MCVSLLLGLLIIIITSVSLSFTVLLDIFWGQLDTSQSLPNINRQTGMADQYQLCGGRWGLSENCQEYKRNLVFFFHKKSDFNINLRFSKARYKKFEILLIGNLTSWKKMGSLSLAYQNFLLSLSHKYFSQSSSNLNKKIINQKILQDRNLEH